MGGAGPVDRGVGRCGASARSGRRDATIGRDSAPRLAELGPGHDENRAVRVLGHVVRDAAEQQRPNAGQPARAHDEDVDLVGRVDELAVTATAVGSQAYRTVLRVRRGKIAAATSIALVAWSEPS